MGALNMGDIYSWFASDAGAGWVFGILSLAVLIYTRRRDLRSTRIVVREIRRIEPISVGPSVKDKIKILFNGREISQLGQIDLEIWNEGKDTISSPCLAVEVPDDLEILDGELVGSGTASVAFEKNTAKLTFEYLNAFKEHKQVERLLLIVDGNIERIKITGGGEGWSVRHERLPTKAQEKKMRMIATYSLPLIYVAIFAYGKWVEVNYGITMSEISMRAFFSSIPLLIGIGAWMIWSARIFRKPTFHSKS